MGTIQTGSSAFLGNRDLYELYLRFKPLSSTMVSLFNTSLTVECHGWLFFFFTWCFLIIYYKQKCSGDDVR